MRRLRHSRSSRVPACSAAAVRPGGPAFFAYFYLSPQIMLSNMKVRTGILLVLGVLLLALLASNGAAWLTMHSSNDKLDRVNSVYSNQVTPVYEAYTLLQRSRLNLAAAAVELQAGRFPERSEE